MSCIYEDDAKDILDEVVNAEFLPPLLRSDQHLFGFGYIKFSRSQKSTIIGATSEFGMA